MKNLVILFAALLIPGLIFGQGRSISGHVSDAAGEPLAGVNVLIKGTMTGAMSGPDGEYTIKAPVRETVLVFSFIGMETQEISVEEGRNILDVIMDEAEMSIAQTVITGYTQTSVKKIT